MGRRVDGMLFERHTITFLKKSQNRKVGIESAAKMLTTSTTPNAHQNPSNISADNLPSMPSTNQTPLQINSFKEEDILHLLISEEREASSVSISLNVTAELNADGELIGVESQR